MIDPLFIPPPLRSLPGATRLSISQAANQCVATAVAYLANNYPGTGPVTNWGGTVEANIRPPAANAFGLAILLSQGFFDATQAATSLSTVTAAVVRYVDGLARTHTANGGTWGGGAATYTATVANDWQSAFWAAMAGTAGALMWSSLSSSQQSMVSAMVVAEANRFIGFGIPTMRNRSGQLITSGDTKAEEITWNSHVMYLAAAMLPTHANAAAWRDTATSMAISAVSIPSDVTSNAVVQGKRVRNVVSGSNIELSGTVENHGFVNPNYTAAVTPLAFNGLLYSALTGNPVPAATVWRYSRVYRGLTDVVFTSPPHNSPGGTIYTPGSAAIYYPASDEGDPTRMACFVGSDVLAHVVSGDAESTTPAATWAALHAQNQLDLQAVNSSARRSDWDLMNLSFGLLGDATVRRLPGLTVSNSPLS